MSERAHESSNHSNQAWDLDHSLETVTDSKLGTYELRSQKVQRQEGKDPHRLPIGLDCGFRARRLPGSYAPITDTPITDFAVMSNVTYNLNSKCSICVFAFNNQINILISSRGQCQFKKPASRSRMSQGKIPDTSGSSLGYANCRLLNESWLSL